MSMTLKQARAIVRTMKAMNAAAQALRAHEAWMEVTIAAADAGDAAAQEAYEAVEKDDDSKWCGLNEKDEEAREAAKWAALSVSADAWKTEEAYEALVDEARAVIRASADRAALTAVAAADSHAPAIRRAM